MVASQMEIIPILQPSASKLDSLVCFYQRERLWVRKARAALEQDGSEDESDTSSPSPPSSPFPLPPSPPLRSVAPLEKSDNAVTESPHPAPPSRRKKDFQLTSRSHTHSTRPHGRKSSNRPYVRVLDMYDAVMQSRMESCERVNALIRNANRAKMSRVEKRYSNDTLLGVPNERTTSGPDENP